MGVDNLSRSLHYQASSIMFHLSFQEIPIRSVQKATLKRGYGLSINCTLVSYTITKSDAGNSGSFARKQVIPFLYKELDLMGQHVYIDVYWQPSAMGLRSANF